MSKNSRDCADNAKKDLKTAKKFAAGAKEWFKSAGDPDGEKHAAAVEKVADDAVKYVEKRLGGPKNDS
jgi:hypothetical protein